MMHARAPETLWGEAVATAVYTLNRSINRNSDKTPFEAVSGRKPDVSHLRVFGCAAYVKPRERKRSGYQRKLESRSQKLIFVGYERNYTYRLFDMTKKAIIVSREVKFDERVPQEICVQDSRAGQSNYLHVFRDDDDMAQSEQVDTNGEPASDGENRPQPSAPVANREAPDLANQEPTVNRSNSQPDVPNGRSTEPRWSRTSALRPRNDSAQASCADAFAAECTEPTSGAEALADANAKKWVAAMDDEYSSLIKNGTWELV